MTAPARTYDVLAELVAYPTDELRDRLSWATRDCERVSSAASAALGRFAELAPIDDLVALRELHTRTFDVQALTCLDIGYTLFGEDYKRGALLAGLSREHTAAGVDCGLELGDHLSNVLRLIPRMADVALQRELVEVLVVPALRAMIREFSLERIEKKESLYQKHHKTLIEVSEGERRTAYRALLDAVLAFVEEDFGVAVEPVDETLGKFSRSIGSELAIEDGAACATTG